MKSCSDHSRRNAVHTDIVVGKLSRQRAGKLRQCSLGNLISDIGNDRSNPSGRRNQDDGSFLFLAHLRYDFATEVENRVNVHVKGTYPIFLRDLEQSAIDRTAG